VSEAAVAESPAPDTWLLEARRAFEARFPAPRLGTQAGDAVAWSFANICAGFDDGAMARCLVQMGLRRVATVARGDIAWWQPDWLRPGMGFSKGCCARSNRTRRDSRVFLLREVGARGAIIPPPGVLLAVDVDAGDGAWRTCSGGAMGEEWISLGAFCWRCTRGQAATRIVKLCGYRRLPRVGDIR
jgi:hypothetical protein